MLFGRKKLFDLIIKYFNEKKISYEKNASTISFTASYNDFSIYPYMRVSDEESSVDILINIRKIDVKENVFFKINEFNTRSKYFKAILDGDAIVLEYNTVAVNDNIDYILDSIIDSLSSLREEIKEL
ncbi:MAG: YbjN domain-containing protein [Acholeplasmatales bacterium]|nr:YbjN domain-containing protein [Acholeplasmatales bacterium]